MAGEREDYRPGRVVNKRRRYFRATWVLLILLALPAGGCRSKSERLYRQALKEARRGEFDSAVASLRQYLQLDPQSARGYNALGRIYRSRNNYSQAIEELEKALDLDQEDPLPPYNLAAIYQQMENIPQARQYYQLSLKNHG